MARAYSHKEAKQRAGRFCSLRERSPLEVHKKLKTWGIPEKSASDIVLELIELNYINEQRFAYAYCHDKFMFNSWGRQKIRAGIGIHQLPEAIVSEALGRIDEEKYEEKLYALASKKWNLLVKEEDLKRKQKTQYYLANKGYEMDLVWKALGKLEQDKGQ